MASCAEDGQIGFDPPPENAAPAARAIATRRAYIEGMSVEPIQTRAEEPLHPEERMGLRLALAAFGLMFAAGAVMWLRFGPAIFMDAVNVALGCF
jgi:hypothetical protein